MITELPLKNLHPRERNPRSISREAFEKLCVSIQKDPDFLKARPLLVYKDDDKYIVYGGNQRLRAAKKLGFSKIHCFVTEYDEKLIKERTIKDNVSSGDWDWDILSCDYEIDELLNLGLDEDDVQIEKKEEKPKPPQCKIEIKFDSQEEMQQHQIFLENYCEQENLKMSIK